MNDWPTALGVICNFTFSGEGAGGVGGLGGWGGGGGWGGRWGEGGMRRGAGALGEWGRFRARALETLNPYPKRLKTAQTVLYAKQDRKRLGNLTKLVCRQSDDV